MADPRLRCQGSLVDITICVEWMLDLANMQFAKAKAKARGKPAEEAIVSYDES